MGTIEQISFDKLIPGEDDIYWSLRFFLECETPHSFYPIPVRPIDGKFVALDGRNRTIASYLRGLKEITAYVASHAGDYLLYEQAPHLLERLVDSQNDFIRDRWDICLQFSQKTEIHDYHQHIQRLKKKLPILDLPLPKTIAALKAKGM